MERGGGSVREVASECLSVHSTQRASSSLDGSAIESQECNLRVNAGDCQSHYRPLTMIPTTVLVNAIAIMVRLVRHEGVGVVVGVEGGLYNEVTCQAFAN